MKKILVIDDDKMVLLTLRRLFVKEGYRVIFANSGDEALKLLKESGFNCDLIISDLKMPGMNGVEVLKRIRDILSKMGKAPIPEIIITGYAKEEIYQDALMLNASAYVEKPFDIRPLLEAIYNLIGKCE